MVQETLSSRTKLLLFQYHYCRILFAFLRDWINLPMDLLQVACYAVAVGLFFFFLCVFSWMLAEGIHIYFMVVRVFDSGRGRNIYYTCIGWGKLVSFLENYIFFIMFQMFQLQSGFQMSVESNFFAFGFTKYTV